MNWYTQTNVSGFTSAYRHLNIHRLEETISVAKGREIHLMKRTGGSLIVDFPNYSRHAIKTEL